MIVIRKENVIEINDIKFEKLTYDCFIRDDEISVFQQIEKDIIRYLKVFSFKQLSYPKSIFDSKAIIIARIAYEKYNKIKIFI